MPIGVHGDLYIGGDGLARGYLNRPELMAERFIRNPFRDDPDARLYRTGDRARYRPDGDIEFLGRLDNQVKIRGHRVELGEIEAALNQHAAVKGNVVVARARDSSGEKELIGYIVTTQESLVSVHEVRRFLQGNLPEYMIPSAFVFLNALPLTPNGKVDRNALPSVDGARPELDRAFIEPRTEIEELISQVWREVLKIDRIGVYDNFFDLGGHSLLATRVIARLRKQLQHRSAIAQVIRITNSGGFGGAYRFPAPQSARRQRAANCARSPRSSDTVVLVSAPAVVSAKPRSKHDGL